MRALAFAALAAALATPALAGPMEDQAIAAIETCRTFVTTAQAPAADQVARQKGFRIMPAATPHYMWTLQGSPWPDDTIEIVTDTSDGPFCTALMYTGKATGADVSARLKAWAKAQGYRPLIENFGGETPEGEPTVQDVLGRTGDTITLTRPSDPKSETAYAISVSK
jgi:hypothetical protein